MERRGRWYRRRSRSLLFSVHSLSVTAEFMHYLICQSSRTCDKKNKQMLTGEIRARRLDTAIQLGCEPVLHLVLLASQEHMIVCLCVHVSLSQQRSLTPSVKSASLLTLWHWERNKDTYQTSNDEGDSWGKCALTCCHLQFTSNSLMPLWPSACLLVF